MEAAACTAARIGEISGVRKKDVDRDSWLWTVRRQTTSGPGGLIDKGTKGKRARAVPLIEEVRPVFAARLDKATDDDARLFTGPRGGRISTAVLRDATHWDEVVAELGYEHLRRHDLRHTGLTWMADAGVPIHVLRKIAGHGSLTTTQRYLHPDRQSVTDAGDAGEDVTVFLPLPVTEPPAELPAPALYRVLPEVEAAVAVRRGPAASIFPMVYQDLGRWIEEHGYHFHGQGREVCGSTTKRPHGPWPAGIQDPAAIHPLCSHR